MASLISDPKYFRLIFTRQGKRKSLYFRKKPHFPDGYSKKEMTEIKKKMEYEFKYQGWSPWSDPVQVKSELPTSEALKRYRRFASQQLAKSTVDKRIAYLQGLPEMNVHEITHQQLNEFINAGTVSYNTKKARKQAVNRLWLFLSESEGVDMPELKIISTKAQRRARAEKTWITAGELEKVIKELHRLHEKIQSEPLARRHNMALYNAMRPRLEEVFRFVFYTGLRLSDIHHFRPDWISKDKKFVTIGDEGYTPKSQELNETIPVMPETKEIIDRWYEMENKRLFNKVDAQWISKTFKKCVKAALPDKANRLSFHRLRDSATMYWLDEKGLSVRIVQQILRHKDISTTMIYTQHNPEHLWEAVNAP